jgi:hypothetical protein
VEPSKTARAARSRDANGDPQIFEQIRNRLDFKNTTNLSQFQAQKLARRFGLTLTTAAAVAGLAFENLEVRS